MKDKDVPTMYGKGVCTKHVKRGLYQAWFIMVMVKEDLYIKDVPPLQSEEGYVPNTVQK